MVHYLDYGLNLTITEDLNTGLLKFGHLNVSVIKMAEKPIKP